MGTTIIEAQLPEGVNRGEHGETERTRIIGALKTLGVDVRLRGTTLQMEVDDKLLPRVKQTIQLSRAEITAEIDKATIDMDEEL